ncbi:hypothetical protein GCM10019016_078270 [Streptomyces prasinosporus]|uniref:Uncharacterized protein n=1 Tax=Streptomyces prasinosporus TaxID=68256 RepID=A0ABP6U183_9ACTN|nr:hypothetical protein GCM10010332_19500 [Streptomyces albogriseolus]
MAQQVDVPHHVEQTNRVTGDPVVVQVGEDGVECLLQRHVVEVVRFVDAQGGSWWGKVVGRPEAACAAARSVARGVWGAGG